jgi:hypothetical protein
VAYEQSLQTISAPANADLSTKQYYGVTVNSSGKIAVAGATAPPIGVLQNDPAAANLGATVGFSGVSKCVLGGTGTAGTIATCKSDGTFQNAVSGEIGCGIFMLGGSSGEIGSVLLMPFGKIY